MDEVLIVFCENVPEIVLSFVVGRSKSPIFYGTNFELYSCNYFGMEGVRVYGQSSTLVHFPRKKNYTSILIHHWLSRTIQVHG